MLFPSVHIWNISPAGWDLSLWAVSSEILWETNRLNDFTNFKKNCSALLPKAISGLDSLIFIWGSSISMRDSKTTSNLYSSSFYCLTQPGKGIHMRTYCHAWPNSLLTGCQRNLELWRNVVEIIFHLGGSFFSCEQPLRLKFQKKAAYCYLQNIRC